MSEDGTRWPAAVDGYLWMPGVWGREQHICSNPVITGYGWAPLAACMRAVIVAYPADDPVVPWTRWAALRGLPGMGASVV
jgi:hypothetical protein